MKAVIEMSGRQYRVEPEQVVYVDLTGNEIGKEIEISNVLLVDDGNQVKVGAPYVSNAKVTAKVMAEVKAPKITGFKYKKRKNYHRTWGHRQKHHKLQILSISA